jgi:hypothetical protein
MFDNSYLGLSILINNHSDNPVSLKATVGVPHEDASDAT